ncbi:FAD-dependent oxidoreductase [Cohnella sp. GCM10027633]|uniref:FAD-dependent oxidoreductase n=1 Tax=unclassified Cohnella TaxID=2636738 RepID=UPI003631EBE0
MGRIGLFIVMMFILVFSRGIVVATEAETEAVVRPVTGSSDPVHADVVVIGSEIEGVYLAKAAAEAGLSVVILDPRDEPGGQLLQGEMLFLDEPTNDNGQSLLQGGMKELFDRYKQGDIRKPAEFRLYYESLIEGIPIESGVVLRSIDIRPATSNHSRKSVGTIVYSTRDGVEKRITATYYVENTDHAALTSRLGLRRIPGIETIFGGGPKDYMAATLMMNFRNVDWNRFRREVMVLPGEERERRYGSLTTVTASSTWGFGNVGRSYAPSSEEWMLRGLNIINQGDGEAAINALLAYNVDSADPDDIRRAMEEGRRETRRVLLHLRQSLPGWEQAEINGYPSYLYVRDCDRYETEYVLKGTDAMSGTMFWDNVSIAGYAIDLQGTMHRKWGLHKGKPDRYGMPLRAFLSKGYDNVIVAGKAIGASAVAYGSARIQPNTALAAEVIVIMLGKLQGDRKLIDLDEGQMASLRQYVRQKHGIALDEAPGANKILGLNARQVQLFDQGLLQA